MYLPVWTRSTIMILLRAFAKRRFSSNACDALFAQPNSPALTSRPPNMRQITPWSPILASYTRRATWVRPPPH
ncbi:hypothetical protein OG21DRAFT_1513988 [Imleria badia]|nr:hypothetical protein OG21DRAFT_1513988 [Imleria badia]